MMVRHIAFYGLLNPGHGPFERLGLADALEFVGPCRIRGRLYDLGDYPALVRGEGMAEGRLYRIRDPRVLKPLDGFEAVVRDVPKASEYLRRPIRLDDPAVTAWVYIYNRRPPPGTRVPDGPWRPQERVSGSRARAVRNRFAASS
jgi:gamma-glutamylcyclotransferase (GGCT)/AIG2-like uncharacterized protein YtfP